MKRPDREWTVKLKPRAIVQGALLSLSLYAVAYYHFTNAGLPPIPSAAIAVFAGGLLLFAAVAAVATTVALSRELGLWLRFQIRPKASKPPWHLVFRFNQVFIPRRYQEEVTENMIAQFHIDYCEALADKRFFRARLLTVYFYFNAIGNVFGLITSGTLKKIVTMWKLIP